MRKYRFAHVYLSALLVCASLVSLAGACSTIALLAKSVTSLKHASNLRQSSESHLDSETIVRSLAALPELTKMAFPDQYKSESSQIPVANGFPRGTHVTMSLAELAVYAKYLHDAETYVHATKESLVAEFDASIETLRASAQNALQSTQQSAAPRDHADSSARKPTLYVVGAITKADTESLQHVSNFLTNETQRYTPSAQALSIATLANQNVTRLIRLLATEVERQTNLIRRETWPTANATHQTMPTAKSELVRDYLENLRICQVIIRDCVLADWSIDESLRSATEDVTNAQTRAAEAIARARGESLRCLLLAMASLLGSAICSVLLMAVRDFMMAVIDTATSAARIDARLENLEVASEGPS